MNTAKLWSSFDFILIAFLLVLASCAQHGLKPDEAMATLNIRDTQQAGDATVIIEGCGNQPNVGWTYCRFKQGAIANGQISLKVPPAVCRPENSPCVSWLIIRPDGTEFGGDVPRGQVTANIPLATLVNSQTIDIGARGPFAVLLTVKWVDTDGRDRESRAVGEIYMRVLRDGYTGLQETPSSRQYVWAWSEGAKFYRMTTALRAYVGVQ